MSRMVQKWLKIARTELSTAQVLSNMGLEHASTALFLCQQVTEKSIKAYLIFEKKKPKKTHNIKDLVLALNTSDKHLNVLLNKANSLSAYAVRFRYPQLEEKPITTKKIKQALKIAEKVYDSIIQKINE